MKQEKHMDTMLEKHVIIYGGKGALGSTCVEHFKSKGWWVICIDMGTNEKADANVLVKRCDSFTEQAEQVTRDTAVLLGERRVDTLLCVAGGWAGGGAIDEALYKKADLMWKQSVWTSTICAHLATRHLKEGGLLTLAGAKAALAGTPGMLGYGMAKAAVHHLCQSLGGEEGGLPSGSVTVAILPVTLDTPMNRNAMPQADFSTWTPLDFVAEMFFRWATGAERPVSGSLVQLLTSGGETQAIPVQD